MSNDPNGLTAALDRFAAAVTDSTKVTLDLSDAVRASEKARAQRRLAITLAGLAAVLLIILNSVLAVATLRTQSDIQECTNPNGACARRSAANSARVIQNVNQAQLAIGYVMNRCQLGNVKTEAAFDTCVAAGLKAMREGTLKSPALKP